MKNVTSQSNRFSLLGRELCQTRWLSAIAIASSIAFNSGFAVPEQAIAAPEPSLGNQAPIQAPIQATVQAINGRSTPLPSPALHLPDTVAEAVLEDALTRSAQRTETLPEYGVTRGASPVSTPQLKIVEARERIWRDGCLELPAERATCPMILVPGWQVTVESGQNRWVYHTDLTGGDLGLDRTRSDF